MRLNQEEIAVIPDALKISDKKYVKKNWEKNHNPRLKYFRNLHHRKQLDQPVVSILNLATSGAIGQGH